MPESWMGRLWLLDWEITVAKAVDGIRYSYWAQRFYEIFRLS